MFQNFNNRFFTCHAQLTQELNNNESSSYQFNKKRSNIWLENIWMDCFLAIMTADTLKLIGLKIYKMPKKQKG